MAHYHQPEQTKDVSQWVAGVGQWISTEADLEPPSVSFRKQVSRAADAEFPAQKRRYHLYIAYACPWSHRVLIMRHLKCLQSIISVTAMHWEQDSRGWRFATASEQEVETNMVPDPHHDGFTHLRDIYLKAEPTFAGPITTPVLYDLKNEAIVSNESGDILKMMDAEFDDLLPPENQRLSFATLSPYNLMFDILNANKSIDNALSGEINKAGLALTQDEHNRAVAEVFAVLDRVEEVLQRRSGEGPYFFGARLTETDIRLFTTLIRFDPVYVQHFKLNLSTIRSGYPEIHKWLRRLYWSIPAFKETTDFEHIKKSYTKSQKRINPTGITPLGPEHNILPLDNADDDTILIGRRLSASNVLAFQEWQS